VIIALKNLMVAQGRAPAGVVEAAERILETGRSAVVTTFTTRRREELGLPPLGELDPSELRALLDADASNQEEAAP